jgi:hypothetical protein
MLLIVMKAVTTPAQRPVLTFGQSKQKATLSYPERRDEGRGGGNTFCGDRSIVQVPRARKPSATIRLSQDHAKLPIGRCDVALVQSPV